MTIDNRTQKFYNIKANKEIFKIQKIQNLFYKLFNHKTKHLYYKQNTYIRKYFSFKLLIEMIYNKIRTIFRKKIFECLADKHRCY